MLSELSPTFVALISALLGGSGLKFIDYWLGRSKTKDDSAAQFRTELRDEVKNLRDQVTTAEENEKVWREKYYESLEENIALRAQAALDSVPAPKPRAPRKKPATKE